MEVVVVSAEPEILPDQVVAMQEVGVQGMDVNHVDEATDMDALALAMDISDNGGANVSNQSPCLSTFFDSIQVTESPPGCLIQVGDGATL